ncbi:MAG: hypothetical protein IKH28_07585, partial [Lachnospiraceae bacterium]|nr:hypothetical protein [Lachnospiraceae bacterium]
MDYSTPASQTSILSVASSLLRKECFRMVHAKRAKEPCHSGFIDFGHKKTPLMRRLLKKRILLHEKMPRTGIEPVTRGFSVLC